MSLLTVFKHGLQKTRENLTTGLSVLFSSKIQELDDFLEELESILISSDVGVDTTFEIVAAVRDKSRKSPEKSFEDVAKKELVSYFTSLPRHPLTSFDTQLPQKPHIILLVGVNGSGKTTTAGKLAYNYRMSKKNVLLVAADTFRAAASEQLEAWSTRTNALLVRQEQGSDPGAVVHDALTSAIAKKIDVVIIDTAGRLHNKTNLMNELSKIKRVCEKKAPLSTLEVFLVIDANTGQNAVSQAKTFTNTTGVTGLIITKLEGTAKGGSIISISKTLQLPVCYVGMGENPKDLHLFDHDIFIEALLT